MIERLDYKDKSLGKFAPRVFDASNAFGSGRIVKEGENYRIRLPKSEQVITPDHIHDLLPATILGLNEALVNAESGVEMRDILNRELAKYRASEKDTYGVWVLYPYDGKLVHYATKELHKMALLACNSSLLMDPERKLDYNQIRNIFGKVVPAIAGLSVGSNIGWSVIQNNRPDSIKVSDPASFKLTNTNRVPWLGYQDLVPPRSKIGLPGVNYLGLREKQQVFSLAVLAQDPFMNIFSYGGIDGANVSKFLEGGGKEPKATIVIDVCDTIDVKIQLAQEARKQKIRLLRFTDAGSTVRVDIRPFDTNPDASLAYGISDDELLDLLARTGTSDEGFFRFAGGLIGEDHLNRGDEFGDLISGKIPKHYISVPQLGSTAAITGGMAGEIVARMALGFKYPERFVVDYKSLTVEKTGQLV